MPKSKKRGTPRTNPIHEIIDDVEGDIPGFPTKAQIDHIVASQGTPWAQYRQALLEIRAREAAIDDKTAAFLGMPETSDIEKRQRQRQKESIIGSKRGLAHFREIAARLKAEIGDVDDARRTVLDREALAERMSRYGQEFALPPLDVIVAEAKLAESTASAIGPTVTAVDADIESSLGFHDAHAEDPANMREPMALIRALRRLDRSGSLSRRVRRLRELLSFAGEIPNEDSAWLRVSLEGTAVRSAVMASSGIVAVPEDGTTITGNVALLAIKAAHERHESETYGISTWSNPREFLSRHRFLERLAVERPMRMFGKYMIQLPPLDQWTVVLADGSQVTLVSDIHPGSDVKLEDRVFHIVRVACDELEHIDRQIQKVLADHQARRDEENREEREAEENHRSKIESQRRRAVREFRELLDTDPIAALSGLRQNIAGRRAFLAEPISRNGNHDGWQEWVDDVSGMIHLAHATLKTGPTIPVPKGRVLDDLYAMEEWCDAAVRVFRRPQDEPEAQREVREGAPASPTPGGASKSPSTPGFDNDVGGRSIGPVPTTGDSPSRPDEVVSLPKPEKVAEEQIFEAILANLSNEPVLPFATIFQAIEMYAKHAGRPCSDAYFRDALKEREVKAISFGNWPVQQSVRAYAAIAATSSAAKLRKRK